MSEHPPAHAPKSEELHPTVVEHAIATGNAKPLPQSTLRIDASSDDSTILTTFDEQGKRVLYRGSAEHNAAAALHGWRLHDVGDPIRMPRAAYEAALKAAAGPVTRALDPDGKPSHPLNEESIKQARGKRRLVSNYEPHPAAKSPFAPKE